MGMDGVVVCLWVVAVKLVSSDGLIFGFVRRTYRQPKDSGSGGERAGEHQSLKSSRNSLGYIIPREGESKRPPG
jgi:hypothetical protein